MRVSYSELKEMFTRILVKHGAAPPVAELCAGIIADNSRDGVHSHGLNRFPGFVKYIRSGYINLQAEPIAIATLGSMEQWDGQLAPGMYTATLAMRRAMELARGNGMGCVAVKNTNHWMRGATYGWQAAEGGCIALCGTNAIANMPPWGGKEPTLANNPLVIAVPYSGGHLVLDMALSQFSYGKMNEYRLKKSALPVLGGYDEQGELSKDPEAIISSRRTLPVGFWKGSGLSMMMDVLVSCLSGGNTVKRITENEDEYGVSQFFLCLSPRHIDEAIIDEIIAYAKSSAPAGPGLEIRYPGEQTLARRKRSEREGVEVNESIWKEVCNMA